MENNTHLPAFILAEHNKVYHNGLRDMVCRQLKTHRIVNHVDAYSKLVNELLADPAATVLLCVSLPGFDITKHLFEINENFPLAKIILSSCNYSRIYAELVRQRKVAGYIVKCSLKPAILLKAIENVNIGLQSIPAEDALPHANNKELIDLEDERTHTVFNLMVEGKTQVQISEITGIKTTPLNHLHLTIKTIALQHSKYGVWGYAMLHNLITVEMLREHD